MVIGDIKEVQAGLELGFLAKQPEIEAEALKLLGSSKEKAVAFLTGYSVAAGKQVYDTWKKLNGDLLLHYFDGVKKDSTFRVVNVGYPDSFKKQIVAESGDILKMREIPGIGVARLEVRAVGVLQVVRPGVGVAEVLRVALLVVWVSEVRLGT